MKKRERECREGQGEKEEEEGVVLFSSCTAGPVVRFPFGESRVRQGDNLTVTCDTGGSNPPVTFINITSDGRLLTSISNLTSVRLDFTITNTSLSDHRTVYVCTAVNDIGTTSVNFPLIVQGM